MPSSTVENYLKQIFMLQPHSAHQLVSMGKLAEAVGVAPGTATAMVKALAESNLVKYERRGRVKLSPSGKQLALHVLRRHRLIELFLVNVLGLDWSQVHEEAEELEHAIVGPGSGKNRPGPGASDRRPTRRSNPQCQG